MSMSMRAKARGVFTAVMKSKPSAQFDYALGAGADLGGGALGVKPPLLLGYHLKNDVKSGRST